MRLLKGLNRVGMKDFKVSCNVKCKQANSYSAIRVKQNEKWAPYDADVDLLDYRVKDKPLLGARKKCLCRWTSAMPSQITSEDITEDLYNSTADI